MNIQKGQIPKRFLNGRNLIENRGLFLSIHIVQISWIEDLEVQTEQLVQIGFLFALLTLFVEIFDLFSGQLEL